MKRTFLLLTLILLLMVGCGSGETGDHADHSNHNMETDDAMSMEEDHANLDLSTSKMSDNSTFHVTVEANVDPVPINELHTWTLKVMDSDMQPVNDAVVGFGGGMPAHNHGFPTEPQIVSGDSDGEYVIEGVRMQMSGHWTMELDIKAGDMVDTITFNIVLP
ncbi:MAG: FixH family protein [Candidatus Promineifilaceae bacterium]